MTINQKQEKLDQRAAALRENLKKRKTKDRSPTPAKTRPQDAKNGSA